MTIKRSLYIGSSILCISVLGTVPKDALSQESTAFYPVEPIPMAIDVSIPDNHFYVGENFPVTIRIVNPNDFDVLLAGFTFGPLEPHMEISFPEGTVFPVSAKDLQEKEFIDVSQGGTISAIGGPPVRVPAQGYIEHRRLIYSGTALDTARWSAMPAGLYRVRMKATVGAITPERPRRYPRVDWTSDVVEFLLQNPVGRDWAALEFLRRQANQLADRQRQPSLGFRPSEFKLSMYRHFLDRFSGTVYAPEIRWKTAKLLLSELGNHRIPDKDVATMVQLLEACLMDCLERGGAYADDFLGWDAERGGSSVLELVRMHCRAELFGLLVEKLDERYPGDDEAKSYRGILRLVVQREIDAARAATEEFKRKFPDSKYERHIRAAIRKLERNIAEKATQETDR